MGISSIDRATENLVDIGLENRVRSILAAGITLAPAGVPTMVVGTAA